LSLKLLKLFSKASITLCESSKLPLMGEFGKYINQGVVKSLRRGQSAKLTADNIDGLLVANQVRIGHGNKSYHYTHCTYLPERGDFSHLPMERPLGDVETIDLTCFVLSDLEENHLKGMYRHHIGRILSASVPAFKWMDKCLPKHIPHEYSDLMAEKSEVFPLQVYTLLYSI
jgi:hypothetical protein